MGRLTTLAWPSAGAFEWGKLSSNAWAGRTKRPPTAILAGTMLPCGGRSRCWRAATPLATLAFVLVAFRPFAHPADLDVFLRAARALLHGRPVYPRPTSAAVWSQRAFVYPYLTAWSFVPLTVLPVAVARAVFVAGSAVAVALAAAVGGDELPDPWRATLVLLTTFTITGLQAGALSPLLFAGTVLAWRLRRQPAAFALVAAPLVASKLFLAPLLLWPLIAGRRRAFAASVGGVAALVGTGFVVGPIGPGAYATLLSQLADHESRSGFGLAGGLSGLGLSAPWARVLADAAAAVLLGAAAAAHRRTGDERRVFAAALAAALLATPTVWSHYLVLVDAALIVLAARRRWFAVAAAASWTMVLPYDIHLSSGHLWSKRAALVAWLLALVAFAALVCWRRPRPRLHSESDRATGPWRSRPPSP